MIKHYKNPEKDVMSKLIEQIQSSELVFAELDCNFMGQRDKKSLIFRKGKLIFTSSNHSVVGISTQGRGVSVVINPTHIDDDKDLQELQKSQIDDLKYSDFYIVSCSNYDEMLKYIKEIGKIRNNNVLYKFFNEYREHIEGMAELI